MAKKSSIENNARRRKMAKSPSAAAGRPKAIRQQDQADGTLRPAQALRNCHVLVGDRIRNRCEVTGRPRAYYRKLKLSRIALRELGAKGLIPGLVKSSW
jgi:small subunit ribosomal protein S14